MSSAGRARQSRSYSPACGRLLLWAPSVLCCLSRIVRWSCTNIRSTSATRAAQTMGHLMGSTLQSSSALEATELPPFCVWPTDPWPPVFAPNGRGRNARCPSGGRSCRRAQLAGRRILNFSIACGHLAGRQAPVVRTVARVAKPEGPGLRSRPGQTSKTSSAARAPRSRPCSTESMQQHLLSRSACRRPTSAMPGRCMRTLSTNAGGIALRAASRVDSNSRSAFVKTRGAVVQQSWLLLTFPWRQQGVLRWSRGIARWHTSDTCSSIVAYITRRMERSSTC
mmetsp:Transcript_39598/g.104468  ORF Transcript_39598/g.104468 Transcript_39598/m.104468 type:complete len:281 (+) Transcript_39598:403-1245(+)